MRAYLFFLGISLYDASGDRQTKHPEPCSFCAGLCIYVYDTPEDPCTVHNSHYHRCADPPSAHKQAKAYSSLRGSHVRVSCDTFCNKTEFAEYAVYGKAAGWICRAGFLRMYQKDCIARVDDAGIAVAAVSC